MIVKHAFILAIAALPGAIHAPVALAEPPSDSKVRAVVRSANRAYQRHDYDEAAHAYASLPPTPDRPAEVCYNEGLTFAAMGDTERARLAFRMADLNARADTMRADARFNLGRLAFDGAMALSQEEPEKSIAALREAARVYRSVLDVRSDDAEAAKNVERCRLAIKAIQERLRQEAEQQQERNEQLQQMAQQLRELSERQQEASEQSQSADQQMQQDSSIGAEATRQSQEQQEPLSEETRELLQRLKDQLGQTPENQPGQTEMSEAMSEVEEAMQNQAGAKENLQRTQPGNAAPQQEQAAQDLAEAAARLEESIQQQRGNGQGQNQNRPDQPGEGQPGGEEPGNEQHQSPEQRESTPEPRKVDRLGEQDGDPIARQYLEKEIRDRASRIRRGPPLPTDKDW